MYPVLRPVRLGRLKDPTSVRSCIVPSDAQRTPAVLLDSRHHKTRLTLVFDRHMSSRFMPALAYRGMPATPLEGCDAPDQFRIAYPE